MDFETAQRWTFTVAAIERELNEVFFQEEIKRQTQSFISWFGSKDRLMEREPGTEGFLA